MFVGDVRNVVGDVRVVVGDVRKLVGDVRSRQKLSPGPVSLLTADFVVGAVRNLSRPILRESIRSL